MSNDETTKVSELKKKVAQFRDARDWRQFHNPKNLAMAIAVEASELMELFQWKTFEESDRAKKDKKMYQEIRQELADVIWFCLSFAAVMEIDVSSALEEKAIANTKRYPKDRCKSKPPRKV